MRVIKLTGLYLLPILALGLSACGLVRGNVNGDETPGEIALSQNEAPQDKPILADSTGSDLAFDEALPSSAVTALTDTAADLEAQLVDLYQRANPAVVFVIVPPLGTGSGFVFSEEGHIVTNNHVVESGRDFEVVFASGERQRAQLIGADADSDLAVLKVEVLPEGVTPLEIGDSDQIRIGQFAVTIGNPFGEQGSMSLGIISGLNRSLPSQRETAEGSFSLPEVIQTDAPINPGNSGGPLLNLQGEVLGVNSSVAGAGSSNSGVGFAVPANALKRIVPSLIDNSAYAYPYMGASFDGEISLIDQSTYDLSQAEGVYVVSLTPGGPADEAGLRAADADTGRGGDLVVAVDGRPVRDFADFNSYLIFQTEVGQSIELTVLRQGQEIVLPLVLGERP